MRRVLSAATLAIFLTGPASAGPCPAWIDERTQSGGGGGSPSGTAGGDLGSTYPNPQGHSNGSHATNGSIPNARLANPWVTVNGTNCALGGTCGPVPHGLAGLNGSGLARIDGDCPRWSTRASWKAKPAQGKSNDQTARPQRNSRQNPAPHGGCQGAFCANLNSFAIQFSIVAKANCPPETPHCQCPVGRWCDSTGWTAQSHTHQEYCVHLAAPARLGGANNNVYTVFENEIEILPETWAECQKIRSEGAAKCVKLQSMGRFPNRPSLTAAQVRPCEGYN